MLISQSGAGPARSADFPFPRRAAPRRVASSVPLCKQKSSLEFVPRRREKKDATEDRKERNPEGGCTREPGPQNGMIDPDKRIHSSGGGVFFALIRKDVGLGPRSSCAGVLLDSWPPSVLLYEFHESQFGIIAPRPRGIVSKYLGDHRARGRAPSGVATLDRRGGEGSRNEIRQQDFLLKRGSRGALGPVSRFFLPRRVLVPRFRRLERRTV